MDKRKILFYAFFFLFLFLQNSFAALILHWDALDVEPKYVVENDSEVILTLKVYNENTAPATIDRIDVKISTPQASPSTGSDISQLILYNSSDNIFDASDTKVENKTLSSDPGFVSFSPISINLDNGATTYFFIMYELKSAVISGSTIDLKLEDAGSGGHSNDPTFPMNLNSGWQGGDSFDTIDLNISSFTLGVPSQVESDAQFEITVTAVNRGNSTITGFTGKVNLTADAGKIFPQVTDNFTSGSWDGYVASDVVEGQIRITADDGEGHTGTSSVITIKAKEESKKAVAYPNPLHPDEGTKIRYYLSEGNVTVRVKIFTLTGELVLSKEYSHSTGGDKSFEWYARNGANEIVESGGYICLIEKNYRDRVEKEKIKIAVIR